MITPKFELPDELKPEFRKAKRLECFTVFYLASVVAIMFLVMGSSQAMKTAWLEDTLSLIPAISFLVASRFYDRPATNKFPYGYHRAFSIAFLCGSVALLVIGLYLAIDSAFSLIKAERPTIGSVFIFGHQVWMGWVMIGALLYSGIPPVVIGTIKKPIAEKLHNKIMHTDAVTQKADYLTSAAAIGGVLGIGWGYWWADSVAAIVISLSIVRDGVSHLKNATADLMDRHPTRVDDDRVSELIEAIEKVVLSWSWVDDYAVRFREHGQVYFGEVFIILSDKCEATERITRGTNELKSIHWKVFDVTIMPVKNLPERECEDGSNKSRLKS
ncbi:cation diffusion facilitator family transporter [uncultured Marinobacter sp.]|uniref:cation diffusion facilitator family transporter n=1 Tax=uncultured Marinobacter sp. TaxID=187379 RepID=UPI00261F4FCA|nr:cation diffusion facilitator family transporter [uncultured Marinobacter sp.]